MTRAANIVIIGGGIIGCLTAWFLREAGHEGPITVVERDSSYKFASTALSAASIRLQFACPVNVELSLFGLSFLRAVRERLDADSNIGLVERGYLILAGDKTLERRREALAMQRALGAEVVELDRDALRARYEWLSLDGVTMATIGDNDEGWFDAWSLLQAARRAALRRGVTIIESEAVGLRTHGDRVTGVALADGRRIAADWCVNAAGALSGRVSEFLDIPIPVVPRKRTVFHFKAPLDARSMPMLIDLTGAWLRPEGEGFIGGIQPDEAADPNAHDDFEPDHALFEERLWPVLAERVPALEQVRLLNTWAGHYEMNLFDQNGIIGPHPKIANFVFATGFSGHGLQHAPGAARAVAEQIVSGAYRTIDVTPLAFERIAEGRPMVESAIY